MLSVFLAAAVLGETFRIAPTQLVKSPEGWQILREGKPYIVKGIGYQSHLELAAKMGANSLRTWGDEGAEALLDRAHKLGMTVTVGFWMGHERHGFNYSDEKAVAEQKERARKAITRLKDHPAVLMWAIGNEMEGFAEGGNENIWKAVEDIAKMAKEIDPGRPTMTVIAEVGGQRIPGIHKHCPSIDIVGINSYGGIGSVVQRYKDAGGTKPVIITEFGPRGAWELPKNDWGVTPEPTSTVKGTWYKDGYADSVVKHKDLTLGSYAFIWGWKQEVTATWFGMLLKDGTVLASAEEISRHWTGKEPANRVPVIESLEVVGSPQGSPGASIRVKLAASDPEGDKLTVQWALKREATELGSGGDFEPEQPEFPGAVVSSSATGAEIRLPEKEQGYRLFVFIRDGKGGGATGNVTLNAIDSSRIQAGTKGALPFYAYKDEGGAMPWIPSGHMGTASRLSVDMGWKQNPKAGSTCAKFTFASTTEWAGVAFQHPEGDWGDKMGGYDLRGAKSLKFWARGETGEEIVNFDYGLLGRDKPFFDTSRGSLPSTKLTKDWKEYTIDLAGKDLSRIKTGFAWSAASTGAPVVFYVDEVRFE